MLPLLTLQKPCAVRIRHIISTGKNVEYRFCYWGGGETTQKYLPANEALLLLKYQAKWLVAYGRLQKSMNSEIS